MLSSDERLARLLQEEFARLHPDLAATWTVDPTAWNFRVASPVEPCEQCGHRVFLVLGIGRRASWERIGPVLVPGSGPRVARVVHECGGGEAWSVEAALFAAETMAEWNAA